MSEDEKVESGICPFCAVEVRDGAVFCFNCGKGLVPEEGVPEEVADEPAPEPSVDEPAAVEAEPATRPVTKPKGAAAASRPRIRVATAAKRRPRPFAARAGNFSWSPVNEGPGAVFVLGVAGIATVTIVILGIALYLK